MTHLRVRISSVTGIAVSLEVRTVLASTGDARLPFIAGVIAASSRRHSFVGVRWILGQIREVYGDLRCIIFLVLLQRRNR